MVELGMGYDVERFGHPSWTPMESANAAPFVLASEALGESVRRTRDALGDTADEVDADAVISALGCDLAADRVLDGRGDGSSPQDQRHLSRRVCRRSGGDRDKAVESR